MSKPARTPITPEQKAEADRLKEIFSQRKDEAKARGEKLTQDDVAAACEWSGQSAVSQYMSGRIALNLGALIKLSRVLHFDPGQVSPRLVEGTSFAQSKLVSNIAGPPLTLREGRVPVIGTAQLGTQGYFEPMEYPVGHGDGYLLIHSDDQDAYGLKVVGNSMMPRIRHGEFVVIEPNHGFAAGDEVLVRTEDGQAMIKEFISCRDGQYRFQSINNDFEPIYIDEDKVECIQFMSAIVKASRYVP